MRMTPISCREKKKSHKQSLEHARLGSEVSLESDKKKSLVLNPFLHRESVVWTLFSSPYPLVSIELGISPIGLSHRPHKGDLSIHQTLGWRPEVLKPHPWRTLSYFHGKTELCSDQVTCPFQTHISLMYQILNFHNSSLAGKTWESCWRLSYFKLLKGSMFMLYTIQVHYYIS